MYHAACEMLVGCCLRAARALEEAEPDALAHLDFPPSHWKRLRTNNLRERAKRENKRGSRVVQVFPSESSLLRLVGAVMCDQAETWAGSRYFSERKMAEMHDAELRRGALGCHDWAELGKTDRKMVDPAWSLLTAWRRPRISIDSGSWMQGAKCPLHQLSRHYPVER